MTPEDCSDITGVPFWKRGPVELWHVGYGDDEWQLYYRGDTVMSMTTFAAATRYYWAEFA